MTRCASALISTYEYVQHLSSNALGRIISQFRATFQLDMDIISTVWAERQRQRQRQRQKQRQRQRNNQFLISKVRGRLLIKKKFRLRFIS